MEKLFINLGEPAWRVGDQRATDIPGIPWRRVIGLRNILARGYERVAHEVLYKTIADDLPALEALLCRQLANLPPA